MKFVQADTLLDAIKYLTPNSTSQQQKTPQTGCCSNPNSPPPAKGGMPELAEPDFPHFRPSLPSPGALPLGHMAVSGDLQVFSTSAQAWVSAKLIGVAIDPSLTSTPPGSFLVEYYKGKDRVCQESIPPNEFAHCMRASSW